MCSSSGSVVATGISTRHLAHAWPDLWPLLKPAYDFSPDKDDLLAGLLARDFQLFAVYDKSIPVAGIVTKLILVETTSGDPELHCHLWLIGGSRVSDWAHDFITKLIPWAKAEGCRAITGNGRRGWARIVARFGGVRIEDSQGMPCWRLAV